MKKRSSSWKSSNKIDWTPSKFPKQLFEKHIKAGWKHVSIGISNWYNRAKREATTFFLSFPLHKYTINKYQYLSNVFLITFKEVLFVCMLELWALRPLSFILLFFRGTDRFGEINRKFYLSSEHIKYEKHIT